MSGDLPPGCTQRQCDDSHREFPGVPKPRRIDLPRPRHTTPVHLQTPLESDGDAIAYTCRFPLRCGEQIAAFCRLNGLSRHQIQAALSHARTLLDIIHDIEFHRTEDGSEPEIERLRR